VKFANQILSYVLVLAACSGCVPIPYHAVVRPGINGIILDAQTGLPIVGANITVNSTNIFQGRVKYCNYIVSSESATAGTFSIPPQKKWWFEFTPNWAPMDGSIEGYLLASHTNYETYRFNFDWADDSLFWRIPMKTNLSKIYLQPLPK